MLIHTSPNLPAVTFPLNWRWSNPAPHGANILDMTYSTNGLAVQVGERGQIFTSTDFDLWIPRDSHTTRSLRGVAFFGGRLVVTAESGTVLFADDPAEFFVVNLGTTDWLESVAASTNLLVAVGDNAAIYTSTNAVSWQRRSVSFTTWLRSVAWGAPGFVTVGENGFIASSANGTNWTQRASGVSQHLNRVAWIGNQFWAVGDSGKVLTSATGTTWSPQTSGATNSLFAAAGRAALEVVAGEKAVRLHDGLTWTNQLGAGQLYPPPPWNYYASVWDGGGFWLGGASGMLVEGYKTNATSQTFWGEVGTSVRDWLWAVLRTPSFYLAAGDRAVVLTSGNGVDWDLLPVPNSVTNATFLGVGATAGDHYFVLGTAGAMLRSTNGATWDAISPRPATNDLQGFTSRGNLLLASGSRGTILTSIDGTNWSRRTTPTTTFLSGLETFPGGFVASGDNGALLTSTNGTNWSAVSTGTTNWFYRVRWLNGVLLAVGENGALRTSTNGTAWTPQTSGTSEWLTDAAFVDGAWFAVGTAGAVVASTNLTTWTNIGTLTRKSLFGIAATASQLVAVGGEGVILRAQVVPDLTPVSFVSYTRSSSRNVFLLGGRPDQRIQMLRSTTLTNWTPDIQLEFLDGTGTLLFLENQPPGLPYEFYRAVLTP
ncbi:MAG: hypothetical protein HZA90_08890 [Verrucomicrobia bacterium]|nr:hypothetical protein [Verrucomicrobiota bacterium]